MGRLPESPNPTGSYPLSPPPSHLYPKEIQLRLYQAFIFSIPILFSIILFLLFYLFYLKRRASNSSSSTSQTLIIPATPNHVSPFTRQDCEMGSKGDTRDIRLTTVLFDEDQRARDSVCCVCLGEFEIKEKLLQIPFCKHVFHINCIHHWLISNSTCPLCRASVIVDAKFIANSNSYSSSEFHGGRNRTDVES